MKRVRGRVVCHSISRIIPSKVVCSIMQMVRMVYSYIITYSQVKQNYFQILISSISHLHWLCWAAGTERTVQETLPDTGQELCFQPPTHTISHPQTLCSPLVSAVQNRNIVICFLFLYIYTLSIPDFNLLWYTLIPAKNSWLSTEAPRMSGESKRKLELEQ